MKKLIFIFCFFSLLNSSDMITPIPSDLGDVNSSKAKLGKKLFFDPRLSKDNTISCASCHDIYSGGADKNKTAIGINQSAGKFNSPTILNSKYNFSQFWDGRAENLEDQILGPIHNPIEMGANFPDIIKKLTIDKDYKKDFANVYNSTITKENIIESIVEFEKSLITPNSKFDKYLNGQKDILTKNEKEGYKLFKDFGCISCHNGVNIGGNLYQKVGIISQYFPDKEKHYGRYNITKNVEDKFYFKVPSLRNIALTSPYLHDGSISNLENTIEVMLKYQIGAIYTNEDIKLIEEFLNTLTGEKPKV